MTYCWSCSKCERITNVSRAVKDIDVPPDSCEHCDSTSFSHRAIVRDNPSVKQVILADTGMGWPSHSFYTKPYWPEKKR